jgi:hypothetical protein
MKSTFRPVLATTRHRQLLAVFVSIKRQLEILPIIGWQ